jgi:hypothetical protein
MIFAPAGTQLVGRMLSPNPGQELFAINSVLESGCYLVDLSDHETKFAEPPPATVPFT